MLRSVQYIVPASRENSSRNSVSLTKQSCEWFNSIRKSPLDGSKRRNSKSIQSTKSRHHREDFFPLAKKPTISVKSERLTELNWSTLELRRKYLFLVQLYKIIHGYSDVDYTRYIDLADPTRTTRNHDFKIRPGAARTNYFKFSFFNRYVNDWNSLPNSVMSSSSLNVFKNRLFNYIFT